MSANERDEIFRKLKVKPENMHRFLPHDPVAKYFGLREGDMIKIIRNSETAGKTIAYRICLAL